MKAQPVIYRISYSVHDEVVRPLPQFYFYVYACSEQQALAKLNAYAEAEDIDYRSVAVGYTLPAKELPEEIELESLEEGHAVEREVPSPIQVQKIPAVA